MIDGLRSRRPPDHTRSTRPVNPPVVGVLTSLVDFILEVRT